ncbi:transposase [Pseudomonas shirazica]|nr:transposase [Pseudomonas shirazica]
MPYALNETQTRIPRLFDRPKCRQRNIIERMFGWLKENCRFVRRFDKLGKSCVAMVSLACPKLTDSLKRCQGSA